MQVENKVTEQQVVGAQSCMSYNLCVCVCVCDPVNSGALQVCVLRHNGG